MPQVLETASGRRRWRFYRFDFKGKEIRAFVSAQQDQLGSVAPFGRYARQLKENGARRIAFGDEIARIPHRHRAAALIGERSGKPIRILPQMRCAVQIRAGEDIPLLHAPILPGRRATEDGGGRSNPPGGATCRDASAHAVHLRWIFSAALLLLGTSAADSATTLINNSGYSFGNVTPSARYFTTELSRR